MNFNVPQYIEIEDKVIGPLTIKQAIYLAGGGGIAFLLYRLLPSFLAFPLMIPFIVLALALAFYKVNSRPFILTMQAAISFFLSNKLYVWKRSDTKKSITPIRKSSSEMEMSTPSTLSESRLKDLAWSLDVQEKIR